MRTGNDAMGAQVVRRCVWADKPRRASIRADMSGPNLYVNRESPVQITSTGDCRLWEWRLQINEVALITLKRFWNSQAQDMQSLVSQRES